MTPTCVYLLRVPPDDVPQYYGFEVVDDARRRTRLTDDFRPVLNPDRTWSPRRFAPEWQPVRVAGEVKPENDFPSLAASVPVFSQRAVDALGQMLTANGELLPLEAPSGRYYAYNPTHVVDAMDPKESRRRGNSVIDRYAFNQNKVASETLFRIPQDSTGVYVTEAFARCVRETGLRGMDLVLIWPLPVGMDWRQFEKETRNARRMCW